MAEEGNEDSWLYGSGDQAENDAAAHKSDDTRTSASDSGASPRTSYAGDDETAKDVTSREPRDEDNMDTGEPEEVVPNPADEMEEAEDGERLSGEENSESEEDDDDINVVIGDIKSGPNYNIKQRGAAGAAAASGTATATDKSGKPVPGGKFNMEEFESVGTINGVAAHEFSIDSLEEKPWRKPGADITDYFNYGFNEETWRMYCERQKRMRQNESGVGLQGLMVAPAMTAHSQVDRSAGPGGRTLTPIANDNSKYGALTSMPGQRRAGPPPTRRMAGPIDVIGGGPTGNGMGKQENVIQVMTAERREYSRPGMPGGGKFDMPPPVFQGGPGGPPPHGPSGPRSMGGDMMDAFGDEFNSYGYEPTQDSQWGAGGGGGVNPGWGPGGLNVMPQMVPAPMGPGMGMPPQMMQGMPPHQQMPPHQRPPMDRPSDRDRSMRAERSDREARDRERDRSERGDKDRSSTSDRRSRTEREGSRRRDRSRSRERSRRRSRSREKTRDRERERSSRSDKKDKDKDKEKDKDKKREVKEEVET